MNRYKKGVRLEYEVMRIFKENGWEAVRSAGSHSPFDITLIKYTPENKKICFVAFVQCKVKKIIEKKEKEAQPDAIEQLLSS